MESLSYLLAEKIKCYAQSVLKRPDSRILCFIIETERDDLFCSWNRGNGVHWVGENWQFLDCCTGCNRVSQGWWANALHCKNMASRLSIIVRREQQRAMDHLSLVNKGTEKMKKLGSKAGSNAIRKLLTSAVFNLLDHVVFYFSYKISCSFVAHVVWESTRVWSMQSRLHAVV